MSGLADLIRNVDSTIFNLIGETALVGTTAVPGIFRNRYHEIELVEGGVVGFDISFSCQVNSAILALQKEDLITIDGFGEFRFSRRVPERGDESGHVYLELWESRP